LWIRRERRELAELLVASKFNDEVREWALLPGESRVDWRSCSSIYAIEEIKPWSPHG